MATVSVCSVSSSLTPSGVHPATSATSARSGPSNTQERTTRPPPSLTWGPRASASSTSRASVGNRVSSSSPSPSKSTKTVASPPTTSASPSICAACRAWVSARAAGGSSTPMSSARSPNGRISPTGTERVGARPAMSGMAGGRCATAIPADASASRTARARAGAFGVSPCTHSVSTGSESSVPSSAVAVPRSAKPSACAAAVAGSSKTEPGSWRATSPPSAV